MSPPAQRLVFPAAVEGLLKGLGEQVTPQLLSQLKARGVDVAQLPPAMPIEIWGTHLDFIRAQVFPELERDEGLRRIGRAFIEGWQRTLVGSAAAAMLKLVGPTRTLPRLTRAFRTSDNFSEATTELLSAKSARITINDVNGMPTMWLGTIEAGLAFLVSEGEVLIENRDPPGVTLLVTWR